ncbi:MAG: hypothetical protein DRP59_01995 [Spirochaetes bacterium]|nr:MAG: hypothetical protein DRP59_01995 [Spirochaetota bacterium]
MSVIQGCSPVQKLRCNHPFLKLLLQFPATAVRNNNRYYWVRNRELSGDIPGIAAALNGLEDWYE